MKIAVVGGAGAMGGVWAGHLHAGGHEVWILDVNQEANSAINRDGLTIASPDGTPCVRRVSATDSAGDIGSCDAVIVFTKSHHTRAAIQSALPLISPSTTVLTLQNGWGNADTLAEFVAPAQLALGVSYHSATLRGPGNVAHTFSAGLTFAGPYLDGGSIDRAREIGDAMSMSGIAITVTPDVKTEVWKKLVLNAAGLPVAALTRLTTGGMGSLPPVLDVIDILIGESVAVGRAKGFAIDLDERLATIHRLFAAGGAGKASMLQDVEARRKTEIEVVNGAIVREGDALGVDVTLNRVMQALVHGLEQSW